MDLIKPGPAIRQLFGYEAETREIMRFAQELDGRKTE